MFAASTTEGVGVVCGVAGAATVQGGGGLNSSQLRQARVESIDGCYRQQDCIVGKKAVSTKNPRRGAVHR